MKNKKIKITLLNFELSPSLFLPIMQEILIKQGYECDYIYVPIPLNGFSHEEFTIIIRELKDKCRFSGLIGISCMTNTFVWFTTIAKELKSLNIPIVVGGIHPTVKPEESLNHADYVCIGEGEEALVELADRIDKKKRTDNIKNIYLKKNGEIIKNSLRPIIKDLNKLPLPGFRLNKIWMYHDKKIVSLEERKDIIKTFYKNHYYIMSSRGCPYRCGYCLNDCLIKVHKDFLTRFEDIDGEMFEFFNAKMAKNKLKPHGNRK